MSRDELFQGTSGRLSDSTYRVVQVHESATADSKNRAYCFTSRSRIVTLGSKTLDLTCPGPCDSPNVGEEGVLRCTVGKVCVVISHSWFLYSNARGS